MSEFPDWTPSQYPGAPPTPGQVHLWIMALDSAAAYAINLPDAERQQAERFLRPADGLRFAAARGGMREILGNYLGVSGTMIGFGYGSMGKPDLRFPRGSGLRFNLSHSGNWALLAVTQSHTIGVDLEVIRPRTNARQIARRVFESTVYRKIKDLPESEFQEAFFAHWTALEARVKCLGKGVFEALDPTLKAVNFKPAVDLAAALSMAVDIPPEAEWEKFLLAT